jgi:hypothetical protein
MDTDSIGLVVVLIAAIAAVFIAAKLSCRKTVAVAQRFLCVLVDRNGRLDCW